jgi:sarcosine oxidase subunit beta
MSKAADAIVVGCGVIGSSVAYYLSKAGLSVVVLERGDVASGTSSACDGNVLVTDKMPGFDSQMTFESQKLYDRLENELGYDFEYRRLGSTLAVEDEGQEVVARDWVRRQTEASVPMRYLEGALVHEDEPKLARDIIGLVECASDSSLNPMAVVFGFTLAAKRNGAEVRPFTEVRSVLRGTSGQVEGVDTSAGPVYAPKVVLTAGVWTPSLAAGVGIDVPVIPRKGHILVAERTAKVGSRKMMEFGYLMAKFGSKEKRGVEPDMEEYGIAFVFEPTPHGNFLIGSSREFVGFDTTCNPRVLELLATRAIRFYPCIRDVNVVRSYAGLRPYTPDHLPIVSPVEEVPGLYVVCGHEGDGIGLSPITGLLTSQMLTGESPTVSLEPLSMRRFKGPDRQHQGTQL